MLHRDRESRATPNRGRPRAFPRPTLSHRPLIERDTIAPSVIVAGAHRAVVQKLYRVPTTLAAEWVEALLVDAKPVLRRARARTESELEGVLARVEASNREVVESLVETPTVEECAVHLD